MIAVDAMGGDFAPYEIVKGSFWAAQKKGIPVTLYGDAQLIEKILMSLDTVWYKYPIKIINCAQIIHMEDEPGRAFLKKKDSSLVRAVQAVAQDEQAIALSAGNTGAGLIVGSMILGKINGLLRPALGEFLPTKTGSVFCMDLGANVDCRPEHLYQFARMGTAYVSLMRGIKDPKVAILSNGAESSKGSKLTLATHQLLSKIADFNFIGNCEPSDILQGRADVIICDGFTGNVFLKTVEAVADLLPQLIEKKSKRFFFGSMVSFCINRFFEKIKRSVAEKQQTGALLLGLQKPCIITHGASRADAIFRALIFAHDIVMNNIITKFNSMMSSNFALDEKECSINEHFDKSVLHEIQP